MQQLTYFILFSILSTTSFAQHLMSNSASFVVGHAYQQNYYNLDRYKQIFANNEEIQALREDRESIFYTGMTNNWGLQVGQQYRAKKDTSHQEFQIAYGFNLRVSGRRDGDYHYCRTTTLDTLQDQYDDVELRACTGGSISSRMFGIGSNINLVSNQKRRVSFRLGAGMNVSQSFNSRFGLYYSNSLEMVNYGNDMDIEDEYDFEYLEDESDYKSFRVPATTYVEVNLPMTVYVRISKKVKGLKNLAVFVSYDGGREFAFMNGVKPFSSRKRQFGLGLSYLFLD